MLDTVDSGPPRQSCKILATFTWKRLKTNMNVLQSVAAGGPLVPTLVANRARIPTNGRQSRIGIVPTQQHAMFGPTGKETVWLAWAASHQVIEHYTDVRLVSRQSQWPLVSHPPSGIDTCNPALPSRFFISTGAIDLARGEIARGRSLSRRLHRSDAARPCRIQRRIRIEAPRLCGNRAWHE